MAFDRSAWPFPRVLISVLGMVIAVAAVWGAVAIPGTHHHMNGDSGGTEDWTLIKMAVGIGGLFVAGLVLTIASRMGE